MRAISQLWQRGRGVGLATAGALALCAAGTLSPLGPDRGLVSVSHAASPHQAYNLLRPLERRNRAPSQDLNRDWQGPRIAPGANPLLGRWSHDGQCRELFLEFRADRYITVRLPGGSAIDLPARYEQPARYQIEGSMVRMHLPSGWTHRYHLVSGDQLIMQILAPDGRLVSRTNEPWQRCPIEPPETRQRL